MSSQTGREIAADLAARVLEGDRRAAARALTLIENRDPRARAVLKALYPRTGRAHAVGVTGAAGSGKSTLIACLTRELRGRNQRVGVLMVDPSSPFSGGALLGDRLRMRDHFLDDGVFMRSFATRRGAGGVSPGIAEAVQLLDAMGEDVIFVETIGIGQDQLQVATVAHTVIAVLPPGGDEVQAMKAGILEIADIVAVNKADLPGAFETAQRIRALFEGAELPVLETSALGNQGIGRLLDEVARHREKLLASGGPAARSLSLSRQQLLSILQEGFLAEALEEIGNDSFEAMLREIAARRLDPYTAAEGILKRVRGR
jgi:LAO/AO transport system kinase